MTGTGQIIYTERWSGITSQALTFTIPCSAFEISVDDDAEWFFIGNHPSSSAAYFRGSKSFSGLNIPAGSAVGTLGADVAIDASIIVIR